jgi:hypothetical protein
MFPTMVERMPELSPYMIIIKAESFMGHQTIPPPEWRVLNRKKTDYPLI